MNQEYTYADATLKAYHRLIEWHEDKKAQMYSALADLQTTRTIKDFMWRKVYLMKIMVYLPLRTNLCPFCIALDGPGSVCASCQYGQIKGRCCREEGVYDIITDREISVLNALDMYLPTAETYQRMPKVEDLPESSSLRSCIDAVASSVHDITRETDDILFNVDDIYSFMCMKAGYMLTTMRHLPIQSDACPFCKEFFVTGGYNSSFARCVSVECPYAITHRNCYDDAGAYRRLKKTIYNLEQAITMYPL